MFPRYIETKNGTLAAQGAGNRLTFAAPSSMLPGDVLIAVIATDGGAAVTLTKSTTWAIAEGFSSAANSFQVLRRVVTDTESSSYYFDVATAVIMVGALLVYRYTAQSPIISPTASDSSGVTFHHAPPGTVSRYTDLFLFGVYSYDNAAGVLGANVEAANYPGNLGAKRASVQYPASGSATRFLTIGEVLPKLTGGAAVQYACGLLAVKPTTSFGFTVPGLPTLGSELKFSPIVPGAIGLPVKGI